jgi:hypothetical protein
MFLFFGAPKVGCGGKMVLPQKAASYRSVALAIARLGDPTHIWHITGNA